MTKIVRAVSPYHYDGINFKDKAYEGWLACDGQTVKPNYPPRFLHHFAFRYQLPEFRFLKNKLNKNEARLRFVQPVTLSFDAFPDYACHEVIPFVWDCWPNVFEKLCKWLCKYNVKTMIVTCKETKDKLQERFPEMNILAVIEGIDIETYGAGKELVDREIDYLEYGRNTDCVVKYNYPEGTRILRGQANGLNMLPYDVLFDAMKNSKVVVAYPKTWTNPEWAGGLETMTQRYWECMLSRMVMIGHAPKELIDFIGYNPVIEVDLEHPNEQLQNVLSNIADYQESVNRNRETALRMASWELRMREVINFLKSCGYEC